MSTLESFLQQVKESQCFWALQDSESGDWVIVESSRFNNSDVMPLWSAAELAQKFCVDDWQSYQPQQISVAQWLEYWVEDLMVDKIAIGIDWQEQGDSLELKLAEFAQAVAEIETF